MSVLLFRDVFIALNNVLLEMKGKILLSLSIHIDIDSRTRYNNLMKEIYFLDIILILLVCVSHFSHLIITIKNVSF